MQALIVIDVQNEFSEKGKRPVPNHLQALEAIMLRVGEARREGRPIIWIRHHNRPDESPAFIPGTWGAEFYEGMGPRTGSDTEIEFQKDVYGAFTGTEIGAWLDVKGVRSILLVGFYTHGCLSTTAREAIMRGLDVYIDPESTGACEICHPILGTLTADEVRRSAILHLLNMGAKLKG
jgi:nicotinamidase-related amidase